MDSQEEKAFFESYGWVYDYIQRIWFSPSAAHVFISNDDLIEYNISLEAEERLKQLIVAYGKKEE